jgi:hypothetical protein
MVHQAMSLLSERAHVRDLPTREYFSGSKTVLERARRIILVVLPSPLLSHEFPHPSATARAHRDAISPEQAAGAWPRFRSAPPRGCYRNVQCSHQHRSRILSRTCLGFFLRIIDDSLTRRALPADGSELEKMLLEPAREFGPQPETNVHGRWLIRPTSPAGYARGAC